MKTIIGILTALVISLAASVGLGEPAQFEHRDENTIVFLDIYNRSWLPTEEFETLLTFFDSTGEVCHRELIYIDFEDPIPAQEHREIYLRLPNLRQFRPTRVEVSYDY